MATNKITRCKAADIEHAEIFWECLRRRDDYRAYYTESKRLEKKFKSVGKQREDYISYFQARRRADKNWGSCFVINPNKEFHALTKREINEIRYIDSGFEVINFNKGELSKDFLLALFDAAYAKGYFLPNDFTLSITPEKKLHQSKTGQKVPSRDSTDIHRFRLEMRVWDMRKDRDGWLTIGRSLDLKIYKTRKTKTPDTGKQARETAARNYWKAAHTKITRCLDLRAVIKKSV